MSQIVEPDLRKVGVSKYDWEESRDVVGVHWRSDARGENEIEVFPLAARPFLLLLLAHPVTDKRQLCGRSERHAGVVGQRCFAPAISCSTLELGRLNYG